MRRPGARATAAGLLVAALAVSSARAQDVVFRTSVDLVTVDATVLGRDGRPVEGLGADDFVLEVGGRPRRVVSAEFVSHAPGPARALDTRSAHFTSNETVAAGRFILLAVDEAHIRRLEGRRALAAAAEFLDTLDPFDYVAVTGLSRVGVIEFTRDRRQLKRRLESLTGHTDPVFLRFNLGLEESLAVADGHRGRLADVVLRECGRSLQAYINPARTADDEESVRDSCPEQVEQEARAVAQHARTQARISLSALDALISSLAAIEGPKTVVVLSEGMVVDPRLIDLSRLAAAAREARVTIYGLHMETPIFEASHDRVSPTLIRDTQIRGDGLGRLAGAARGTVFRLVGSDPRPFERIGREISGYYLLAFEAEPGDRDGRVHRIRVSLARGGGEVRAREVFRVPPVAPSPKAREDSLVHLLRESYPATELPVRVATYTFAEPGSPQLRLVVSAEADVPAGAAEGVLLGYVLVDGHGVIVASGAQRAADGRTAFSTLVPPGAYMLRVAGIDPLERRGLVQRPFIAAVEARDALRVTDLILAPVPASAEAPLHPIVDRVRESRVVAYVELHAPEAQPLDETQVIFEVSSADGAAQSVSVPAELVRHDAPWAVARAVLPLDALPEGSYVARARIVVSGQTHEGPTRPFTLGR